MGRRFGSNVSVGVTISALRSQSGVAEFLVAVVVSSRMASAWQQQQGRAELLCCVDVGIYRREWC